MMRPYRNFLFHNAPDLRQFSSLQLLSRFRPIFFTRTKTLHWGIFVLEAGGSSCHHLHHDDSMQEMANGSHPRSAYFTVYGIPSNFYPSNFLCDWCYQQGIISNSMCDTRHCKFWLQKTLPRVPFCSAEVTANVLAESFRVFLKL